MCGAEFELEATTGVDWEWVNLNTGEIIGSDQSVSLSVDEFTSIMVTAVDAGGCSNSDTYDIYVLEAPDVSITVNGGECEEAKWCLRLKGHFFMYGAMIPMQATLVLLRIIRCASRFSSIWI
ncbi:MAG: Ig domain-containing protein [Saprospiraceae bacterium]